MYAAGHKAETYVTKTLMNCFPTFQTLDVAVLFWMYKAIQHCTSLTHAHVTVPCPESHCIVSNGFTGITLPRRMHTWLKASGCSYLLIQNTKELQAWI